MVHTVCISHVGLNDGCYLLVKLSLMFQSYVCSAYLMAVVFILSCNFAKVEVFLLHSPPERLERLNSVLGFECTSQLFFSWLT
jgi:hypothetical protein